MTVFKTYFKILKHHKITVGISFIIFLALGIIFTIGGESFADSFHDNLSIIRVGIVNNTHNTKHDGLVTYLTETFTVVETDSDPNAIKMALFYRQVEYVLFINESGLESFQKPD